MNSSDAAQDLRTFNLCPLDNNKSFDIIIFVTFLLACFYFINFVCEVMRVKKFNYKYYQFLSFFLH